MDLIKAFHPFDIRGDYPAVVDEELAYRLGKVYSKFLGVSELLVASDNRQSSPQLRQAIIAGAASAGIRVTDLGEQPTPLLYYGVVKLGFPAGIMITASHLAKAENGFKLVKSGALPLDEAEVESLRRAIAGITWNPAEVRPATAAKAEVAAAYVEEIAVKFKNLGYPHKIIIDSGGTIGTEYAEKIFSRLNLNYTHLTSERLPNPLLPEARENISKKIQETGAYLGILWDGDCDRVLFVDRYGELISQSYILGLLAQSFRKAAFDLRVGMAAGNCEFILVPSWAQNLKFALNDDPGIDFAGETSGHLIFRDWYNLDDGLFGAVKFLELTRDRDIYEEIAAMQKRFIETPEENFKLSGNYAVVLDRVADYYRDRGEKVSVIDGVTVFSPEFKINLRPSYTEPLLRLNLEAVDEETLEKIRGEIGKLVA